MLRYYHTSNTHEVTGDIGLATGTTSNMEVHECSVSCKKSNNLQSNLIVGESGTAEVLALMDTNVASSTMSYFLMAPAPMTSRNKRKEEGEKAKECRDLESHIEQRRCLSPNECGGTVQPTWGIERRK